jgi:hypothetical protein
MNATEITNDLAIGSYTAITQMHEAGWKCVCFARNVPIVDYCEYIPLVDGGGNEPNTVCRAIAWIVNRWSEGNKVYSCCRHGMNRSVLIAAAALAVANRVEWFIDGWRVIASKRQIVSGRDDTLLDVLLVVDKMRKR